MQTLLLVGIGGFTGAVLRYLAGSWIFAQSGYSWFPFGTLAINIVGCFLIGLLSGFTETRQTFSNEIRSLLVVGLLGGFTTFSAFGYETLTLVRNGLLLAALGNATGQLILGLLFVWLGLLISKWA